LQTDRASAAHTIHVWHPVTLKSRLRVTQGHCVNGTIG